MNLYPPLEFQFESVDTFHWVQHYDEQY